MKGETEGVGPAPMDKGLRETLERLRHDERTAFVQALRQLATEAEQILNCGCPCRLPCSQLLERLCGLRPLQPGLPRESYGLGRVPVAPANEEAGQ
jgi:hypothetical protein